MGSKWWEGKDPEKRGNRHLLKHIFRHDVTPGYVWPSQCKSVRVFTNFILQSPLGCRTNKGVRIGWFPWNIGALIPTKSASCVCDWRWWNPPTIRYQNIAVWPQTFMNCKQNPYYGQHSLRWPYGWHQPWHTIVFDLYLPYKCYGIMMIMPLTTQSQWTRMLLFCLTLREVNWR